MPTLSRTTNPTRVIKIPQGSVELIRVPGEVPTFQLRKLELSKCEEDWEVVLIARSGASIERRVLGTVGTPDHNHFGMPDLDPQGPFRFRLLVKVVGEPQIKAELASFRCADVESGNSLVDIECYDLNGPLWILDITEDGSEKPLLRVERTLYASALAARQDFRFTALVMPEVFRQVTSYLAKHISLCDEDDGWAAEWKLFCAGLGVDLAELATGEPPVSLSSAMESFCQLPAAVQAKKRLLEAREEADA